MAVAFTVSSMSSFRRTFAVATGASLLASMSYGQVSDLQPLCDAYNQSESVFVGVAAAPVMRQVQFPDRPAFEMLLTPVTVFLDVLIPGAAGGTIAGIVQQKDVTYDRTTNIRGPLEGILVRIFNETYSTEAVTAADGRFVVSGIPAGHYQLVPQLPESLVVWDSTSRITALARNGGCATKTIDVLSNGRVRGVLRGPDEGLLRSTSVDLIPMDLKPDPFLVGAGGRVPSDACCG